MYRQGLADVVLSQTTGSVTDCFELPDQQVIDGIPHNFGSGIRVYWLVSGQKIPRDQVLKGIQACVDQQFKRRQTASGCLSLSTAVTRS